jgi:formylglycine-generating enzyme required for sulfatase activity
MADDLASQIRKLLDLRGLIGEGSFQGALAKLRTDYGDAAVDAILHADASSALTAARSATVTGEVGMLNLGDIGGNLYVYGRRAKPKAELLAGYLNRLAQHCVALPLQALREQRAADDRLAIGLDHVYTQLATTVLVPRERFVGDALRQLDAKDLVKNHAAEGLLPVAQRLQLHIMRREAEGSTDFQSPVLNIRAMLDDNSPSRGFESGPLSDYPADRLQALATNEHVIEFQLFGPQLVSEAIATNQRLVLLGEPGSGKSTALRYLALSLARAGLEPDFDPAAHLEGWDALGAGRRLLPLFLPLLPFARQIDGLERPATADDLWSYIASRAEHGGRHEGLAAAIHDELEAGRVLLLLDGLDEVVGEASRRQVIRAVRLFAEAYGSCRMVVSCRVRAYEGERNRAWQLPSWPTVTLADWTPAQMTHFATAWYAAVSALPEVQRTARAASLRQAIATRTDLRRLGVRPLLMTIMALVHLNDQGQLPEGRVALYNRCVDLLLGQWELAREDGSDYGALLTYIGLPNADVKALRPLLEEAAYRAHTIGGVDSQGHVGANDLHMLVATFLEERGHANPLVGARKFLDYTDVRAGLLQASDAGDTYVFPHQTFQEYLAGRALVRDVEYVQRIMERRDDDRWRVPILLGVGHLASEGAMAMIAGLLAELLDRSGREPSQEGRDLLLAAEIAGDVGWATLERSGALFERLRHDLALALARHVEGTALPATERVRAGVFLGELGDPRPGVCTLPPAMVKIPGGAFIIGEFGPELEAVVDTFMKQSHSAGYKLTDDQIPLVNELLGGWSKQEPISLRLTSFEFARYPVTNAQFALFIAADGYQPDAPWWTADGRAWLQRDDAALKEPAPWQYREHKDRPEFWDNPRFGEMRPNHPVVGITWYEATAFCAWLTQHVNDGYIYRLPSEAEWEYAARGTARRPYSWGEAEPDKERANYNQNQGGTTVVGCFPTGVTPEGLYDMTGNILEWTRSVFKNYPYDPNDGREDAGNPAKKRFTLRGGSWNYGSIDLRAACRNHLTPVLRYDDIGFRLARHPPL